MLEKFKKHRNWFIPIIFVSFTLSSTVGDDLVSGIFRLVAAISAACYSYVCIEKLLSARHQPKVFKFQETGALWSTDNLINEGHLVYSHAGDQDSILKMLKAVVSELINASDGMASVLLKMQGGNVPCEVQGVVLYVPNPVARHDGEMYLAIAPEVPGVYYYGDADFILTSPNIGKLPADFAAELLEAVHEYMELSFSDEE